MAKPSSNQHDFFEGAIATMNMRLAAWALIALAAPAGAQELRDLCPTRPGLGTAPCIVDNHRSIVELGIADWTLERDRTSRTDTITAADILVRYGVGQSSEVQIGWTAFGRIRERDRASGDSAVRSGAGDVVVAYKRSLSNADGGGFSVAVQPFVSLPAGRSQIGTGDWGAGLLLPMSFEVSDAVQVQLTSEVDAAVDGDGHGRHLAYGNVIGLGINLTNRLNATFELAVSRDRDPSGSATEGFGAVSMAWQAAEHLQLDTGVIAGLNRHSADVELYLGVSRRF